MTFATSRKPYSCWGCEYFVHENPVESYAGYCRRAAPKALDLYGPGPNILSSKGDLMTRDDDELIRLPVGLDGQILVADPAEDSGLKWQFAINNHIEEFSVGTITEPGVYPQSGLVLTTTADFKAGVYLLMASYTWCMSGTTDQFFGSVASSGNPGVEFAVVESGVNANASDFKSAAGQSLQLLSGGVQTITFNLGVQPGGTTDNALAKNVRITAVLVQQTLP